MILGIDHILVAVEDLDKATDLYCRLGFQVLAGGEHPGAGTKNTLVPLADGAYPELIGVGDPSIVRQIPRQPAGLGCVDWMGLWGLPWRLPTATVASKPCGG